MAGGITAYGANALVDHFTGVAALPGTFYIALCSTQPDNATDGTTLASIEPVGGSYARQSIVRTSVGWAPGDQGVSISLLALTYPTASADWGLVTHYAVCSAASAGNVYGYGPFAYSQTILTGDIMTIPVGGLSTAFISPTSALVL
jgi:hypothetical protein